MIRRLLRKALILLWRVALRVFFRRIDVEGLEHVPRDRPLLIVANHVNGLVDPVVIGRCLPRPMTWTGKGTLKKNPYLRLLIWILDAVQFHRSQDRDRGALVADNAAAMAKCRRRLRAGGAVCIFPEGVSHSDPQMRPLKQGVSRIALDYLEEDGNPGGLLIVPVGLNYERKTRFRPLAGVRFGEPIDIAQWRAEHPDARRGALTELIDARLRALSLNFNQWRTALRLRWAAEVLATAAAPPAPLGRPEDSYLRLVDTIQRLKQEYERLLPARNEQIAALSARLHRYRAELRLWGITPAEVYMPLSPARVALFVLREFELLVLGLPLAALGIIGHLVPWVLVRELARKLTRDPDQWASNVIYPGIAIFPLWYLVCLAAAFATLPWGWALAALVALPYCGWYAVLWRERAGGVRRRSLTFFRFLFHRPLQSRLAAEGRLIVDEIRELERLLPDAAAQSGAATQQNS